MTIPVHYFGACIVLGSITTCLLAIQALAPMWLVGAVAIYGFLGTYVALLAKSNLTPDAVEPTK